MPVPILMSRRLKPTIPCPDDWLKSQQLDGSLIEDHLNQKRQQQKKFHKQTKSLPAFESGDVVRMQTPKGYNQLVFVMRAAEQPRSFIVKSQRQEYRRNRRHLLKVPEQNREVIKERANPDINKNPIVVEEKLNPKGTVMEKYSNVLISRSRRVSKPNAKYKDFQIY